MNAGFGGAPVRSYSTSYSVGRNVKVNTTASSADQPRISTNASHGTPGLKYRRAVQSRAAAGAVKSCRITLPASTTRNRAPLQSSPSTSRRNRTRPAQYTDVARPASHQDSAMVRTYSTRPERNGSVYTDSMVVHMATTSRSAGSSRRSHVATAGSAVGVRTADSSRPCHTGIHAITARTSSAVACHSGGRDVMMASNTVTSSLRMPGATPSMPRPGRQLSDRFGSLAARRT